MEKKRSWYCTLITQVALCIALYLSLNLGLLQKCSTSRNESNRPNDVYFISVRGGFRPLQQQTHLLKQIESALRIYDARLVINISELGEDDPLTGNASRLFPLHNIPWYTTRASKGSNIGCFMEKINISHGKTLTVVGLDTRSIQDLIYGKSADELDLQLSWLTQTLEGSTANWIVVAGYHPLVASEETGKQIGTWQVFEPLRHRLVKYGVNAYLSRPGCTNRTPRESIAYIGVPDHTEIKPQPLSSHREQVGGFLLHRVSPLEITTYMVTSDGKVVHMTVTQPIGKAVM